MKNYIAKGFAWALVGATLTHSCLYAGAFQLRQGRSLGNAGAGRAAETNQLEGIYSNPALMGTVEKSGLTAMAAGILPHTKVTYEGGQAVVAVPTPGAVAMTHSNNGGKAAKAAVVPAAYGVWAMSDNIRFGVGITVPFGLTTDYNKNWNGRYFGLRSSLKTLDINPSVSYKVNDQLYMGAGVSIHRAEAELTKAVPNLVDSHTNPNNDAHFKLKGKDTTLGYNMGFLFMPTPSTRVGFSYRSSLPYTLKGHATLSNVNGAAMAGSGVQNYHQKAKTSIRIPEILLLSFAHDFDSRWTVKADAEFTRWDRLQEMTIYNRDTGAVIGSENFGYKNSMFYSLGLDYRLRDNMTVKVGIAMDKTPTRLSSRTVRTPDSDRYWLSCGLDYAFNDAIKVSAYFTHIFGDKVRVEQQAYPSAAIPIAMTYKGTAKTSINILGVKASYRF